MEDLKPLRLANLVRVLDAKKVQKRERAAYLQANLGSSGSFWSGLLGGDRSFGEKIARRIEEGLSLATGTLDTPEDLPLPASPAGFYTAARSLAGQALAEQFDAVPGDERFKAGLFRALTQAIAEASQTRDIPAVDPVRTSVRAAVARATLGGIL